MAACKLTIPGSEVQLICPSVIADTRLGFRTIKGHAVIGIFADKNGEELKEWDLMELTSGVGLEEEVSAMAVSGIDTNFTFS